MGRFTVIPQDTFNDLQLDAGVVLTSFNPSAPAAPADNTIVCATTGGINVSCVPTYSDLGEDVDNCPNNMKELKHLDSWECKMSFTALTTDLAGIRLALGAADVTAGSSKVVPRKDLSQSDFSDLWWVGDRADGGCVAVKLKNALSTGGFTLQTTKSGKGQVSVELTGHVSISAQDTMPMEFYSIDSNTAYTVTQRLTHVTSDFDSASIASGGSATIQLTAETGYAFANVIVLVGGVDVTSSKYSTSNHKVTLSSLAGNVEIIATANVSG